MDPRLLVSCSFCRRIDKVQHYSQSQIITRYYSSYPYLELLFTEDSGDVLQVINIQMNFLEYKSVVISSQVEIVSGRANYLEMSW
jgi:uncharacterized pyridoxamine 5'-phosphate oxidase family protein